jgi:PRTRC genetic system protein B
MNNISNNFSDLYVPYKALLIYQQQTAKDEEAPNEGDVYVESYDINKQGKPINAHPLSIKESIVLGELLQSSKELQNGFLRSKGLLPQNLLYVKPDNNGYAIWYTPPQQKELFFVDGLCIPPGIAHVPAMIWKASRDTLMVYAIKGNRKPQGKTVLYHAPFFNIYANGTVCMGTVHINIDKHTCLEDFMAKWEQYFFGSYFSHTLQGGSRANVNIVQLWQSQITETQPFPEASLMSNGFTLQQLIQ